MKNVIFATVVISLIGYYFFFKGIKFEIINNSGESINRVMFYTSEKPEVITFEKISSGDKREDFLNMRKNRIDGEYILEFIQNGKIKKTNTGYYTNGGGFEGKIIFTVEKDTVLVQFK